MIKKMNYCLRLEETNGLSFGFQTVLCSWRDNYQRIQFELSSAATTELSSKNPVWTELCSCCGSCWSELFLSWVRTGKRGPTTPKALWEIPRGLRSWGSDHKPRGRLVLTSLRNARPACQSRQGGSFGQREVTLIIEILSSLWPP